MKILVGFADRHGGSWWRQVMPLSRLGPAHEVYFTDMADLGFYRQFDLVILARSSTEVVLNLICDLRRLGVPVIMDFDDNIHTMNTDNQARLVYSNGKPATKLFEASIRLPNVVTCSTQRLAQDYAKFRNDIIVCENFLPTDLFQNLAPEKIDGSPKRSGEIRVGFAGSSSHGADLAMMTKPLRKLCEKYPKVKLVFFGQTPDSLYGLGPRIEYHSYVDPTPQEQKYEFMQRYFGTLKALELDVAIAPLQPTVFNADKSFLKALEYGACGYPVVASNFGPYRDYRSRGGPIHLADDDRDWIARLSRLVESPGLRAELATANHGFVLQNHSTEAGRAQWLWAIEIARTGLTAAPERRMLSGQ